MSQTKKENIPFLLDKKTRPTKDTKSKSDAVIPTDKWRIVYFIFLLHGLGTLMPWNMFITAKSYFENFKLEGGENLSDDYYRSNFMLYVSFASQIPNVLFNWLNVFVNFGGDLTIRIVFSIIVEVLVFIVTIILAMLDTSNWITLFFWITIGSVIVLNMANGIYQNTVYGMVATLPIKYTGVVVLGSNMSGLFTSLIEIFSSYFIPSVRTAAIYYFITAMIVLLICFDTYFALPLNTFFRYHAELKKKEKRIESNTTKIPYWLVFKQALPQLFNVFFTFFVTLSVFPTLHSNIRRSTDSTFFIPENQFTSITCFLTFNLFAMLGSLTTSWIQWPSSKLLVFPVMARVVFIPLFILCNYQPLGFTRTLPVFISEEWIYWFIAIAMSFSSGYLSSLGMMYAPQSVTSKYQLTAGMYAAAMLISGIFSGILFAFVMPHIITWY